MMTIFQFGLEATAQTPPITTMAGGNFSTLVIPILLIVFIGVFLFFCALGLRSVLRKRHMIRTATFENILLLVTLPKFRREEESERGPTKEQVQDAVAAAETLFSSVGGLSAPKKLKVLKSWLFGRSDEFTFEIVIHKGLIKFYISIPRTLQSYFEQQLSAAYPDAHLEQVEDYNLFGPKTKVVGSYMIFKRESAFPIKTYQDLDRDPLNAITNAFSKVPTGDGAAFQFVLRSSHPRWRRRAVDIARNMQQGMKVGDAMRRRGIKKFNLFEIAGLKEKTEEKKDYRLSPQEEELVKGLESKASKSGMDVCIRLVASSESATNAQSILANMINAFSQFNIYEYGNSFKKKVPRRNRKLVRGFIYRSLDERRKIVLNSEEMASLWHLPLPWTETPNIKWLGARRGAVPSNVPKGPQDGGTIELGFNMYRGVKTPVWMKEVDRSRHMYIIGKSGTGKSQLIARLATQDICAGHGVAVVDPHGDLTEQILGNIPKERIDDVIYFCPADLDRPMGLNMLETKDPSMKDFAVQEMISIFYKLFPPEMIGPMFEHHMRNVMLTLMSDPKNPGSLIEIPRIFSDESFQKTWRARVKDPVVQSYWVNEVDKTSDFHKSEMLGYLISKVGRFVENEMMRNIIGQAHSSFDFREVMDKKKILLVNLSKGKTGDVNAELLGMIIVTKLQMAALGRADMPESERHDFFLYIDEFQNFVTDSIATILSEARKYRLNLIIAHQYIGQLVKDGKTEIRDAVFGNVGTNFVARIGPEDVETLEKIYSPEFSGYDLINSDKFTWYVKMIVDNSQIKPFTLNFEMFPKGDAELAKAIKELSRLKYARARDIVEEEIMERAQLGVMDQGSKPPELGLSSR